MAIDFPHLHLLLNHFPIIGTIVGLGLFLASFLKKGESMRRASLIVFASMALLTIPTFLSGVGAQEIVRQPGVSRALIQRHEGAAMLSLWFMLATGGLALLGLWQEYVASRPSRGTVLAILVVSIVTVVLMGRTGNTGGDIRHPELGAATQGAVAEGTVGAFLSHFEPTPEKFTNAMVGNRWWWAFMMDLHFLGMALLIGTVGILDLRIMGFAKQIPIKPVHRFLPWAIVGFGINVVTGMLAFIGMTSYYTYDAAFWLKMGAILLLGLNAAAFYLTGIFHEIENLGPGEDAPMTAKLVAASSLFLWFAVITLGRYIQQFSDSIPSN